VPVKNTASPGTKIVSLLKLTLLINRSIGKASLPRRFNTNARPSFHVINMVNATAPIKIGTQPPEAIFNEVEATKIKSIIKNGTANNATFHSGQRQ